jgi:alpha-ketoglutarate-dependent taurine dioxygenase
VDRFEAGAVRYIRHYREHADIPWQTVFQTDSKEALRSFCSQNDIEHEWLVDGTLRTAQTCQGTALHPQTRERVFFNQAHLFHRSSLRPEAQAAMVKLFGATRLPRHACFGDGGEISPESLQAVRNAFQRQAINVDWKKGDVLLLDNMLVAHGRRPFIGERRVLAALLDPRFSSSHRPL